MGTSSARRAPVSRPWRIAKTFASRFASGKEVAPPQAREVVVRYLGALESQNAATKAASLLLPEVGWTAANLGNFYRTWKNEGLEAALSFFGGPSRLPANDDLIPFLLDKLAGPGATLDEAAARVALLEHFETVWPGGADSGAVKTTLAPACPDEAAGVGNFLGLALYRKLTSDLGEALEFHAPTIQVGLDRHEELKACILAGAAALGLEASSGGAVPWDQIAALLVHLSRNLEAAGGR